jgi:biotin synthase-like enzyme
MEEEKKIIKIYATPAYIRAASKRYYEKVKHTQEYQKRVKEYRQLRKLKLKEENNLKGI